MEQFFYIKRIIKCKVPNKGSGFQFFYSNFSTYKNQPTELLKSYVLHPKYVHLYQIKYSDSVRYNYAKYIALWKIPFLIDNPYPWQCHVFRVSHSLIILIFLPSI